MSTVTLNPQVLGRAENAHRALLERILAGTGITYHHWVVLQITAFSGGTLDKDQLVGRVADGLKVDDAAASAAIADLTASGWLESVPGEGIRVALTDAGRTRHAQLSTAVGEVVARLYADLPADDLATAGRVLTVVTARADKELASV